MKILYAEDNDAARYLLETLLKADGYQIVTAPDGEAALQLLLSQPFDLIISDILMPKMDGFILCHRLKHDPMLAGIPFILYSATYTQPDDIAFAKSIGADEFLVKPLPPEEFLRELERCIKQFQQQVDRPGGLDELAFLKGYAQRVGSKLESTHLRLDRTQELLDSTRAQLHQTRRTLGLIIDHSSDAVLLADANGALLLLNPSLKELASLPDSRLNYNLGDLLPPPCCHRLYKLLLENNQQAHIDEFQETLNNGLQVLISASIVQYGHGSAIMLVMRNLERYIQTHASSDLHTHILENLVEGVVITDANNIIISVNPAYVRITGYSAEESLGKTPRMLKSGKQDLLFYKRMWANVLTEGKWQGEIWNRRKNGELYPEWLYISTIHDDQGNAVFYVGIFSDITEHEQARQHIEHLAHHDALTDLPNRTLLNYHLTDAIHHAIRNQRKVAVMFMDLDRFKLVNDTLGHQVGDELLKTVAERLRASVRQIDTVGRQGGDEFLIVIADIANDQDATVVATKILQAIRVPYLIGNQELNVTPSIGIATYPEHGLDSDTLIRCADNALYSAKDEGRNNFQFYNAEMHQENEQRLTLNTALAYALERGELRLVYQPQVRMSDNAIVGCEVLLRWRHPELGDIPPASFIPIAEEAGRINLIGDWVLRTACTQAAQWQRIGNLPCPIAVNLSAIQFRQPNLVARLQQILDETRLNPDLLELELTESILMREANATLDMLKRFKNMQVKLSIDDFGTGYSNLAYLNRFAVNKLKIDQSFVRGLPSSANDAAIVQAIIQLAQSLDLEVIAEGVETADQRDFLIARGCLMAQGYFYAKPLELEEFAALLRNGL